MKCHVNIHRNSLATMCQPVLVIFFDVWTSWVCWLLCHDGIPDACCARCAPFFGELAICVFSTWCTSIHQLWSTHVAYVLRSTQKSHASVFRSSIRKRYASIFDDSNRERLGIWRGPFASCSIGVPTSYQPCAELGDLVPQWSTWDAPDVEKSRWDVDPVGNSQRFFSFFRLTKEYNISDLMKAF